MERHGLAGVLLGHVVITAYEKGWDKLSNGALLEAAEEGAVNLLLTTDRRIRHYFAVRIPRLCPSRL